MTKSILEQLASSLGHRDEQPNIDLAVKIARSANKEQVTELITFLGDKKSAVRYDALKVLYEIGERKPELIAGHLKIFLQTLRHKDNRMQWGAMSALSSLSRTKPQLLAPYLVDIVKAMDVGTVITRDHGIYILCHVATLKKYHGDCLELLFEQLEKAPVNQLPMYAEKTAEIISAPYVKRLLGILGSREDVVEIPSKAKRIEKLARQLKEGIKD
jgi:hypothetical protein